jgi:hypothetical protein
MGAAAALLWRRRLAMSGGVAPQELLGSPRWPPWMGTAAAGRRTDGGRWPETTRGVIRHSPQLEAAISQQSTPSVCAYGPFFCFRAPKWRLRKRWRTNGAGLYKRQYAQTATFAILQRLGRLVADSASFPAHHSWGLVFACQRAARSHEAFAKGPWT